MDPHLRRTAGDMNVYEAANAMWAYGMLFESGDVSGTIRGDAQGADGGEREGDQGGHAGG